MDFKRSEDTSPQRKGSGKRKELRLEGSLGGQSDTGQGFAHKGILEIPKGKKA